MTAAKMAWHEWIRADGFLYKTINKIMRGSFIKLKPSSMIVSSARGPAAAAVVLRQSAVDNTIPAYDFGGGEMKIERTSRARRRLSEAGARAFIRA
jgi:hypothetical protein